MALQMNVTADGSLVLKTEDGQTITITPAGSANVGSLGNRNDSDGATISDSARSLLPRTDSLPGFRLVKKGKGKKEVPVVKSIHTGMPPEEEVHHAMLAPLFRVPQKPLAEPLLVDQLIRVEQVALVKELPPPHQPTRSITGRVVIMPTRLDKHRRVYESDKRKSYKPRRRRSSSSSSSTSSTSSTCSRSGRRRHH